MTDKKQTMRISDDELQVLKSAFADSDDLLISMRQLLFGFSVAPSMRQDILSILSSSDTFRVFRKLFKPELDDENVPLGQSIDLWKAISFDGASTDKQAETVLEAKIICMKMIDQALELLAGKENVIINLNDIDTVAKLIGRNQYLNHIEQTMLQIKILAGLKEETVEQTVERLKQNSTK